jgi:SAM-dependent MidA family methyltransferase
MEQEIATRRRQAAGDAGTHPAGSARDEHHFSIGFQEASMSPDRPVFVTHSAGARKVALPPPDPEALAVSRELSASIAAEIQAQGGAIPFRRYMELALYAPGLGYYVSGQQRFGPGGDFVTAPEMGGLFGATLARAVAPLLGPDGVLEFGAGSGALAAQLLAALPPTPYTILEVSPDLAERQRQRLTGLGVRWPSALPEHWCGVVLANEVLDAIPPHLVELDEAGVLWELGVALGPEGFVWRRLPAGDGLRERLAPYLPHWPRPYRSEVNLAAEAWLRDVAGRLEKGAIILIDYGHRAAEYYLPQRSMGTLRAYYRQHWLEDPFYLPGLCDLTAHLDFDALQGVGVAVGLQVHSYDPLARFLIANGLTEAFGAASANADPLTRMQLANEAKRLTLPQEMGESFKVLILSKESPCRSPSTASNTATP